MTSFKSSNRFKSAWSLSTLTQYESCALKLKYVKIDKKISPVKPSYALEYGLMVHSKLEGYLKGDIKGIPKELIKFSYELRKLKKANAIAEEQLVMDSNWNFIKDGWFHKDAWWRGKTDIRLNNLIIDLKTGRHYPDHENQARLYSIAVLKAYPDFEEIDVEFYYSKSGEVISYNYQRKNLDEYIQSFIPRVEKLYAEEKWLPKKNQWCKSCEFKSICPIWR